MIERASYLAYAPRGAGLLCAVFWLAQKDDIYGWFTGSRGHEHPARYFALGDYYSTRETQCFLSAADDVYGDWLIATPSGERPIDPPVPVPPALCPHLDRHQDAFVREWLRYEEAPAQPPVRVDIRPDRLDRLKREGPLLVHASAGADAHVVAFLSRRWPLDYRLE